MIFMNWFGSTAVQFVERWPFMLKVGSSNPGNDEPNFLNKNKRQELTVSLPSSNAIVPGR